MDGSFNFILCDKEGTAQVPLLHSVWVLCVIVKHFMYPNRYSNRTVTQDNINDMNAERWLRQPNRPVTYLEQY